MLNGAASRCVRPHFPSAQPQSPPAEEIHVIDENEELVNLETNQSSAARMERPLSFM